MKTCTEYIIKIELPLWTLDFEMENLKSDSLSLHECVQEYLSYLASEQV